MNSVARSKPNDPAATRPGEGPDDDDFTIQGLRQENTTLTEENRKLRQLAEYRSAFLARLTHELRTPLTSILGFAEIMLSQEALTEAQRNFCERIQNSALQLQGNFNQLADLSRLEGRQSEMMREEFALEDLLRESCAAVKRTAEKQKVELRFEAAAGLPPVVSDRGKLRQVLYNLLAYAISRSPAGALVTASAEKAEHGFQLTIEDEGESIGKTAGIAALDATDRRSGNSELGLAIARHNIDLVGATVSWESREPHGLRLVIQLPAVAPEQQPP
jgi:signal transduction histidine kinase